MKVRILIACAFVSITTPSISHAQGVPGGIAFGVYEGNRRAGPIGAVVGGAVGGVVGGIEGVLGVGYGSGYQPYYDGAPRSYRHRKVVRVSARHKRRARRVQ